LIDGLTSSSNSGGPKGTNGDSSAGGSKKPVEIKKPPLKFCVGEVVPPTDDAIS
jgi:hypothetical protein